MTLAFAGGIGAVLSTLMGWPWTQGIVAENRPVVTFAVGPAVGVDVEKSFGGLDFGLRCTVTEQLHPRRGLQHIPEGSVLDRTGVQ